MNIQDLINKLETIPESLRNREIQLVSTDDGSKFSVREDVSQFNMSGGKIQIFVQNP